MQPASTQYGRIFLHVLLLLPLSRRYRKQDMTVDVRGRVSVASHLADRSLGFVGDESDMSDLGIVRTSGAANAAPTTRGSLC